MPAGPSGGAGRVGERWARSRASRLAALILGCQAEWMSGRWLVCGVVWMAWALVSVSQGLSGEVGWQRSQVRSWAGGLDEW